MVRKRTTCLQGWNRKFPGGEDEGYFVRRLEACNGFGLVARGEMRLRRARLLLVRGMARHKTPRAPVSETLARVIQRADELAEFIALYWRDGPVPLSGQVKKGLGAAFRKFDESQLAKYERG